MSGAVDVLAVMDADGRAVACVVDECQSARRAEAWKAHMVKHDQARAAVAELIEAANAIAAHKDAATSSEWDRMNAALALVQGGAA